MDRNVKKLTKNRTISAKGMLEKLNKVACFHAFLNITRMHVDREAHTFGIVNLYKLKQINNTD